MNYFTKSLNCLFAVGFCVLFTSCYNNEFDADEIKVNSIIREVDLNLEQKSDAGLPTQYSSSLEIKNQYNKEVNIRKVYENYSDVSQEGLANVILDNGKEEENTIKEKYSVNKNLVFRH